MIGASVEVNRNMTETIFWVQVPLDALHRRSMDGSLTERLCLQAAIAANSAEIHYVSTCPIPTPIYPHCWNPSHSSQWTEIQIQRSAFQTSNVGICSGATNSPTEDIDDACHSSSLSGQRRIETLPLLCPIKTWETQMNPALRIIPT